MNVFSVNAYDNITSQTKHMFAPYNPNTFFFLVLKSLIYKVFHILQHNRY